jgi:hypothetical protein
MIERTAYQSCRQLFSKWTYETTSRLSVEDDFVTTLLIPRLPNHSDWFSLYLIAVNFIAQSMIISASSFFNVLRLFCFA